MTGEFLNPEELVQLTQRYRPKAQRRVLDQMGVRYRVHPDGKLVVPRMQFRTAETTTRTVEPDWGAIHATAQAGQR